MFWLKFDHTSHLRLMYTCFMSKDNVIFSFILRNVCTLDLHMKIQVLPHATVLSAKSADHAFMWYELRFLPPCHHLSLDLTVLLHCSSLSVIQFWNWMPVRCSYIIPMMWKFIFYFFRKALWYLNAAADVHGAMGCDQKSFTVVRRRHQLLSGSLPNGRLSRFSRRL